MPALLIGYDLHRPGRNYESLIAAIKESGTWWHQLDSTWIVRTHRDASQMRDYLKAHIDANDSLLVIDVTNDDWAGFMTTEAGDWLRQHLV
jgi:hypothetical protein